MASTIVGIEQKPFAANARLEALLSGQRRQWLLFAPLCLALGIGLWFALPQNAERQSMLLAALAISLLGLALSGTLRRLVIGAGLLIALGMLSAEWRSSQVAAPQLHHRLTAAPIAGLLVRSIERQGGKSRQLIVRRDASNVDPEILVRLSTSRPLPPGVEPGSRISAVATLAPIPGPSYPGGNDSARRAWFEGISATGRIVGDIELLATAPAGNKLLEKLRGRLSAYVASRIGGEPGAIAAALVTGDRGRMGPELLEASRSAGLAHILSVSGFHVGIVVAGAYLLIRPLLAFWPWLANRLSVARLAALGAGLAGLAYVILSGAEVPAVRALIGAWIVLLALALGRDPFSLRLIAFAAMLILLVRPESLLSPSFQMSFAAVTSLVALANTSFGIWLATARPDEGLLPKAGRLLLALVVSSAVAEIVLGPIALFHFGRTGAYGVLANMVAIPLVSFLVMPLLGAWLGLSILGLGFLVEWALRGSLQLFVDIASGVSALPGASLSLPSMPLTALLLLLGGWILLCLLDGRARLLGLPLSLAGLCWAIAAPRPDLLIGADGRHVAIVSEGQLYMLRNARGGFLTESWEDATDSVIGRRISELPGAQCSEAGCAVALESGVKLYAALDERSVPSLDCTGFDLVVSPFPLPSGCRPGWLRIGLPELRKSGAIAIESRRRGIETVGQGAGDHPWSPSALPGWRPRLLGGPAWTGVIAE